MDENDIRVSMSVVGDDALSRLHVGDTIYLMEGSTQARSAKTMARSMARSGRPLTAILQKIEAHFGIQPEGVA